MQNEAPEQFGTKRPFGSRGNLSSLLAVRARNHGSVPAYSGQARFLQTMLSGPKGHRSSGRRVTGRYDSTPLGYLDDRERYCCVYSEYC